MSSIKSGRGIELRMKQAIWVIDIHDETYVAKSKTYNVPVVIRYEIFPPFCQVDSRG